jgi:hypothetical protein
MYLGALTLSVASCRKRRATTDRIASNFVAWHRATQNHCSREQALSFLSQREPQLNPKHPQPPLQSHTCIPMYNLPMSIISCATKLVVVTTHADSPCFTQGNKYTYISNNLFNIFCARVARWFVFKQKLPIWANFGGALDWKMLIYFIYVCNTSWTFGKFYDHLEHLVLIWYIFSGFGITYQEKSGNPVLCCN